MCIQRLSPPLFSSSVLALCLSFQACKNAAVSDPVPTQGTDQGAAANGVGAGAQSGNSAGTPGSSATPEQVRPITPSSTIPNGASGSTDGAASIGSAIGGLLGPLLSGASGLFGSHGSNGGSAPSSPAPSSASPSQSAPAVTPSNGSIPSLNVGAAGNAPYSITDYGSSLSGNKDNLASLLDSQGANAQEKALVIAMAMQETTLMATWQRDPGKDGTASANCSILNLNYDMLSKLGYAMNDNGASLNQASNLGEAIGYLLKGFRSWGIQKTLNYQRGGSTAFQDGVSYGAADYRNAITTIYDQIAGDPSFETDGRRIVVNLSGV